MTAPNDRRRGLGRDADPARGRYAVRAARGAERRAVRRALRRRRDDRGSSIPRHEQAAAYMAFGYARATGRPGAFAVVPGPGLLEHDRRARDRLRDQRAGAVHLRADPVEPDRPRLRPAARDPGPARDPARADQMGRAHQPPERDRQAGQRSLPPARRRPPAPGRARDAARHHGAGGRGRAAAVPRRRCPAAAARSRS